MSKFLFYKSIKSAHSSKEIDSDIILCDYSDLTNSKERSPLYGPFSLKDPKGGRKNGNIDKMFAIVFDIDDGRQKTLEDVFNMFDTVLGEGKNEILVHETHSSTLDLRKFRVLLPLAEGLDPKTVVSAKYGLALALKRKYGFTDDLSTYNPARVYCLPPRFVVDDERCLFSSNESAKELSPRKVAIMANIYTKAKEKAQAKIPKVLKRDHTGSIYHRASNMPIERLLFAIPDFEYVCEIRGGSMWNTINGKSKGGVVVSRDRNLVTSFHTGDQLVEGRSGSQYAFPQDLFRIYPEACYNVLIKEGFSEEETQKILKKYEA